MYMYTNMYMPMYIYMYMHMNNSSHWSVHPTYVLKVSMLHVHTRMRYLKSLGEAGDVV